MNNIITEKNNFNLKYIKLEKDYYDLRDKYNKLEESYNILQTKYNKYNNRTDIINLMILHFVMFISGVIFGYSEKYMNYN